MTRVLVDPDITRREADGFSFPLGVYPVAPLSPKPGFVVEFEPADESESFLTGSGQWEPGPGGWSSDADEQDAEQEEWPDRFMFDILVPANRIRALWRAAATLLPPRVFPILDVLGNDAYREIDPYIAFELVGLERYYDGIRWFEEWLFEDGLVGFGAMSLDPFVYLFLDEHKILTIRVAIELKERVEKLLAAMELEEVKEIVGPDAAEHEHTGVLVPAKDDNDALSVEEIIERLRDHWALQLNIDPSTNVDDDGRDLGQTAWRCVVRCQREDPEAPPRYADVLLVAGSLDEAEQIAIDAASAQPPEDGAWTEITPVAQDRITPEEANRMLEARSTTLDLSVSAPLMLDWLDLPPSPEPEPQASRPRPHPQGEPRTGGDADETDNEGTRPAAKPPQAEPPKGPPPKGRAKGDGSAPNDHDEHRDRGQTPPDDQDNPPNQ
ncbi:MAG: hypothetical protein ACTS3F_09590 [Phycisphaerales bacterium]